MISKVILSGYSAPVSRLPRAGLTITVMALIYHPADCTLSLGSCRHHATNFAENLTCDAPPKRHGLQIPRREGKVHYVPSKTRREADSADGAALLRCGCARPATDKLRD